MSLTCTDCRSRCYGTPGYLHPGDFARMVKRFDTPADGDLMRALEPVCGPLKDTPPGQPDMRTPLLRPRTRDGKCVFLGADESCSLGDARPSGCQSRTGAAVTFAELNRRIEQSLPYNCLYQQVFVPLVPVETECLNSPPPVCPSCNCCSSMEPASPS